MPTLYIVATPIGNLEDMSLRAIRILGEVDFILCEDTRVTKKLLSHYRIKTPTISYHQHSDIKKIDYLLSLLEQGRDLALVSDAGTPGISDPGGKLVQAVIDKFDGEVASMRIEAVPGPSAVTAALSISGIATDKYIFLGFPPHKKGRQKFLKKIINSELPVVVYESKHRILKFLEELEQLNKEIIKKNKELELKQRQGGIVKGSLRPRDRARDRQAQGREKPSKPVSSVVVCREISKMHETVYRGEIKSIKEKIKESKDEQKGEFVVIIGK